MYVVQPSLSQKCEASTCLQCDQSERGGRQSERHPRYTIPEVRVRYFVNDDVHQCPVTG